MEKDNIKGCFVSSVLLSQNQWDKKQFIHDFEEDWGIVLTDDDDNGDVLVGMFSGMTLAIAIMPGPVPNGEAEHYAQGNYLWKDATEVARQHEAHILVSVTGDQSNLLERAKTVHQSHVFLPETVLRYSGIYRRYGVPTRILQGYGRTPARR